MGSGIEIIYCSVTDGAALYTPTTNEQGEPEAQAAVLLDLAEGLLSVQPTSTAAGWFPEREHARLALGVTLSAVPTPDGANQVLDAVSPVAESAVAATQQYWDQAERRQVGFTPGERISALYRAVSDAEANIPVVRPVPFERWLGEVGVRELATRMGWRFTADLTDEDLEQLAAEIQHRADESYTPGGDYVLVTGIVPDLAEERAVWREDAHEDLRRMRDEWDELHAEMQRQIRRIYRWGVSQYALADWSGWSQGHVGRIVRGEYGPAE